MAIEYLKDIPRQFIPRQPSNMELYRWLKNRSIVINGKKPHPTEEIRLPIRQLVFFKGGKRATILDDGRYKMSWAKRGKWFVSSKSES